MSALDPKVDDLDSDNSDDGKAGPGGVDSKQNRAEKKSRKAIMKMGFKPFIGSSTSASVLSKCGADSAKGKVVRVTVKKAKNLLFVINSPDVYKSSDGQTFIVFGVARIEDMSAGGAGASALRNMAGLGGAGGASKAAAAMMAAQQRAQLAAAAGAGANGTINEGDDEDEEDGEPKGATIEEVDDDEEPGTSTVQPDEKDIDLVMTQCSCTKEKAIAALKANKNDIVEAIMSFNA